MFEEFGELVSVNRSGFPSHIRVTSYNDWPYSRVKTYENGSVIGEGIAFEIFSILVKKFNFKYTIIPSVEDVIGDHETGMMKQILNKEVDMAVAFIPIITQFEEFCEYSTILEEMDTAFLMERPGTSATGSGPHSRFTREVWKYIITLVLIVTPFVQIFVYIRSKFTVDIQRSSYGFLTCVWFSLNGLLKQATVTMPLGDSPRLIVGSFWAFVTIASSFYIANYTDYYSSSNYTLPANSMDELADEGNRWFTIAGRSVHTIAKHNYPETDALADALHRGHGIAHPNHTMTRADILKYIGGRGKFKLASLEDVVLSPAQRIYIGDRVTISRALTESFLKTVKIKGMTDEQRCKYAMTVSNVLKKRRAFAFPRRSHIRKLVDPILMDVVERGIVKHLKTVDLPIFQTCPLDLHSDRQPLRLSDLRITCALCFFGFASAWFAFFAELFSRFIQMCLSTKFMRQCCGAEMPDPDTLDLPVRKFYFYRNVTAEYRSMQEQGRAYEERGSILSTGTSRTFNGQEYEVVAGTSGEVQFVPNPSRPSTPKDQLSVPYFH